MPLWKPMGVARAASSFSSSCLRRSWMSCCCLACIAWCRGGQWRAGEQTRAGSQQTGTKKDITGQSASIQHNPLTTRAQPCGRPHTAPRQHAAGHRIIATPCMCPFPKRAQICCCHHPVTSTHLQLPGLALQLCLLHTRQALTGSPLLWHVLWPTHCAGCGPLPLRATHERVLQHAGIAWGLAADGLHESRRLLTHVVQHIGVSNAWRRSPVGRCCCGSIRLPCLGCSCGCGCCCGCNGGGRRLAGCCLGVRSCLSCHCLAVLVLLLHHVCSCLLDAVVKLHDLHHSDQQASRFTHASHSNKQAPFGLPSASAQAKQPKVCAELMNSQDCVLPPSRTQETPHLCTGLITLCAGVLQARDELVLHAVEALVQVSLLRHQPLDVVLQSYTSKQPREAGQQQRQQQ